MLLRKYLRHQYGTLQHADAMVCDSIAGCGIYRGRKSFVEGYVNERYDGSVLLSDVFHDEMFGCYCECIWGVNTVHCNTLMQWHVIA